MNINKSIPTCKLSNFTNFDNNVENMVLINIFSLSQTIFLPVQNKSIICTILFLTVNALIKID